MHQWHNVYTCLVDYYYVLTNLTDISNIFIYVYQWIALAVVYCYFFKLIVFQDCSHFIKHIALQFSFPLSQILQQEERILKNDYKE